MTDSQNTLSTRIIRGHEENTLSTRIIRGNEEKPRLCDIWKDIQGANYWNSLLNPMNPILKAEILRYGKFSQLCYDAFDGENSSENYGKSKYSKSELFQQMGMSDCGYEIIKYIYANTDVLSTVYKEKSKDGDVWLGFIAVCVDTGELSRLGRRDIVIAWRGTQTIQEWIQDLKDFLVPARLSHAIVRTCKQPQQASVRGRAMIRIESGFLNFYTASTARDLVITEIARLLDVYSDERENLNITVTGHSLGAALATLSAYDIKQMIIANTCSQIPQIPVTVFAFASPRVGSLAFAKRVDEIGVKVLRIVNKADVVPKVPGVFMNENRGRFSKMLHWLPWTYFHVGVQVSLNNESCMLANTFNLSHSHKLEVYLRLIDEVDRDDKPFKPQQRRNSRYSTLGKKICYQLHKNIGIPPKWLQGQKKDLIKGPDSCGRR